MQEGKIHQRILARHQQLREKQALADTVDTLMETNREVKKIVAEIYRHVAKNAKEELY